jgi:hypothetical protein
MAEFRPIETTYKGYRFRSRLEARWAVFFDVLGVRWEYEKEGFDLGRAAGWFLPDFWMPDMRVWVEIKGQYPSLEERTKVATLAKMSGHRVFVFDHPDFERPSFNRADSRFSGAWGHCFWPEHFDVEGDFGSEWMMCSDCGAVGVGHPSDVVHKHYCCIHRGIIPTSFTKHLLLESAYLSARQARFEHGQSPIPVLPPDF